MGKPPDRRGAALLLSLAVLAILSLLGVSFARLSVFERQGGANYVARVRARLAAEAGLAFALARLRELATRQATDSIRDPWVYGVDPVAAAPDPDLATPLEFQRFPSFKKGEIGAAGFLAGYSLELPPPAGHLRLVASLQITDCASQINLNAGGSFLGRILDNLGRAIDETNPPIRPGEGNLIVAWRNTLPGGRLASVEDLSQIPGGLLTEAELARIRPYLTVDSWVNPHTIRPPVERQPAVGTKLYKRPAIGPIELEPRAPININTAPRAVLVAVLAGLSAREANLSYTSYQQTRHGSPWLDGNKTLSRASNWYVVGLVDKATVDWKAADGLASYILTHRAARSVKNWHDFDRLVATWQLSNPPYRIDAAQYGVLRANANPNTRLSLINPDGLEYSPVEKSGLEEWSTEFCFSALGRYRITSLGRLVAHGQEVIASATSTVWTRTCEVLHETSQAQFSQGSAGGVTLLPEPAVGDLPRSMKADGRIMLPLASYRHPEAIFYASFRKGLNADQAAGDGRLVPDTEGPVAGSVLGPGVPGSLLPDGAYSELDRGLAFQAAGNLSLPAGTISFWFKRSRVTFEKNAHLFAMNEGKWPRSQMFQLVYLGFYGHARPGVRVPVVQKLAFQVENWLEDNDRQHERMEIQEAGPNISSYATWHHLCVRWRMQGPWAPGAADIFVDGRSCRTYPPFPDWYRKEMLGPLNDATSAALLRFGERFGKNFWFPASPADGTYAEITILPRPLADSEIVQLASRNRWEKRGQYRSAPIRPVTGRLGTLAWSEDTFSYTDHTRGATGFKAALTLWYGDPGTGNPASVGPYRASEGTPLDLQVHPERPIVYQLDLEGGTHPSYSRQASPSMDDITLTFVHDSPVILRRVDS